MAQQESARFLHIANGTSTTRLIQAAGIPGALSIWADPLYDGPVPDLQDDELLAVRARFLAAAAMLPEADVLDDLKDWRAIVDRHGDYDELILWFEHDLFDQLNLIQLLTWLRGRLPSTKTTSLICIGSFPGRSPFKGLGELSPRELATLLAARERITAEQHSLAERAWLACRQPTPEPLDALRQTDTSALPYLAAAVERFLQEYPWTRDGLSRSERRLLELAAEGPLELAAAFPRMHDGEEAYFITDMSLAALARSLSSLTPPLLTLAEDTGVRGEGLRGSVSLTAAGRAVLAGARDRVTAYGIDRWLGGVHLVADGWRWDDQRRRITPVA